MARKIIVSQYMSLDGVIQDPVGMEGSGLGDWTGPYKRGPVGDKFKHYELFDCDAVLLGRVTYDAFAAVWPHVKDEAGFADRINNMRKYVVSNTLAKVDWNNTTILSGDAVKSVQSLKEQRGGNILVYGSAALVHALMPMGLIDEYNLMVFPTLLGRGIRLFVDGQASRLHLSECKEFGSGIVLLRYSSATQE